MYWDEGEVMKMNGSVFSRLEHRLYLENKQKKIKNKNPTVISSNCNGSVILHDLGLRFNSPTVNLFFEAGDFIKFLKNMKYYLNSEPVQIESDKDYPVGMINDITVYFMHFDSFDEAKEKWIERSKRVDFENLYVIMTDKNGCTYDHIKDFDSLPIKHKVIFTHKPYPEFKSAYYIKGFENDDEVGVLSDWKPGFLKRRWLDGFDYVSFLNQR